MSPLSGYTPLLQFWHFNKGIIIIIIIIIINANIALHFSEFVDKNSKISAIRKCCGNLMVQNSVTFPQDGYDGKRVRWKWRHCFVFPQRFRWLKRVSAFPLRFRKRFCIEICWFSWSIPGFSCNKICFNCTDYASGKMRNHYVDLKCPKEQR